MVAESFSRTEPLSVAGTSFANGVTAKAKQLNSSTPLAIRLEGQGSLKGSEMREITRHEDGSSSWKCQKCNEEVFRFRGQGDVSCECGAQYNAFGQRLRDDWRGNPSNYDDEIGDMEGYEMQHSEDQ